MFLLNFYKEINIVKPVPFIGRWFNLVTKFLFQLTINGFYFCPISIKSPFNYKLEHIINAVLL
jgi:hypothetical protein